MFSWFDTGQTPGHTKKHPRKAAHSLSPAIAGQRREKFNEEFMSWDKDQEGENTPGSKQVQLIDRKWVYY